MDKFKLGGIGCGLGFVGWALAMAGTGGGAAAGLLAYLLLVVSAVLVMVATRALKERFGFRLFQLGGVLVFIGTLAMLAATLAAVGSRDIAAVSTAMTGVFVATLIAVIGWMFIGASLVIRRNAVAEALGTNQAMIVIMTGVLLILAIPIGLIGLLPIGLIPLAFIFFRLARGAPGGPAAAPS